jgi:N-ethylmaleimide reductase
MGCNNSTANTTSDNKSHPQAAPHTATKTETAVAHNTNTTSTSHPENTTSIAKLYQPVTIGSISLANRMIMAPMTRSRSDPTEHKANELMAEQYTQRATAGLIITECTMVSPKASAFFAEPGIYDDAHIEGWKKVTDSVHAAGGKIVLQIWHGGRVCPTDYNNQQPVAPSAIANPMPYHHATKGAGTAYDEPRELTDEECKSIIQDFAAAATRAIAAGFDGVEIHAANGYLINQFLVPACNKRGPESHYSGETIETRARFLFEVVDAVSAAIGPQHVGVRLSPYVSYNEAAWAAPETEIPYVAEELNKRHLAFIHVMRKDMMNPSADPTIDATPLFRKHFTTGSIISNIGFEREEAEQYIEDNKADAISFGAVYLANPDLVRRFKEKRPERNQPDYKTMYLPGPAGYTDYPTLD